MVSPWHARRLTAVLLTVALSLLATATPASADAIKVSGTVSTATGLLDGHVTLYDSGGVRLDRSDFLGGSYAVYVDAPGRYRLGFHLNSYDEADNGATVSFKVFDIDVAGDMTLNVGPPEAEVLVNALGEDGLPQQAKSVLNCEERTDGPVRVDRMTQTVTTTTGTAQLWGFVLSPGAGAGSGCRLTVIFDDGATVIQDVVLTEAGPNEFTVVRPAEVTVTGQFTTPDGPASDGEVTVYTNRGLEVAHVGTDTSGRYRVDLPIGNYEFSFKQGRGLRVWAHGVYVNQVMTVDSPQPWFPVQVHAVDSAGDTPVPQGELALDCVDLVGIVGGDEEFEGLYQEAALLTTAAFPAVGEAATLQGLDIQSQGCSLYLVQPGVGEGDETRTELGGTRFNNGLRDLTYDLSTGVLTEGPPSSDQDGVPDALEDAAPNGGDGNADGTPDKDQPHVTSLPAAGAGAGDYVTVAAPAGLTLVDVTTMAVEDASPPPAGVTLPSGLVSYKLTGLDPGSTHTISVYMGSTDGVNGYAKYDVGTDTWTLLPEGRVAVLPDRVDITLTDGGVGDDDGTANGEISDPGGVAIVAAPADSDPPVVTGTPTTSPNDAGWYREDVRIDWSATDSGSGVGSQPEDTVVSEEGSAVSAESPEVCDLAPTPNCTTGSLTGLKIDKTAPSLEIDGISAGETYVLGAVPAAACSASDRLSGLAGPCSARHFGGNRNGVGRFTYAATAVDNAGNRRVVTVPYRVVYRFDGFAAPLNNPPAGTSVFRRGSTVPVAFSLRRADGQVVRPVSRPVWVTPLRGTRTTLPVNESASSGPGTSGNSFEWRSGRWEYAWSTKQASAGYLYRIGVGLDDGTTRYLTVGVR